MMMMLIIPFSFAHPAAWIFTISPILLVAEAVLGVVYDIVGGFIGKRWKQKSVDATFFFVMGFLGFLLPFYIKFFRLWVSILLIQYIPQ